MSELMSAQGVTPTSRIISTYLSFYLVYFPGFLACSVIMTQILFKKTSDILFLFITLLAGASTITSAHFVASFFSKAQLAGLYTSTLFFALALVTLAASLANPQPTGQIIGLSLVFPPITWANFIGDVALREFNLKAFSLAPEPFVTDGFDPPYRLQKMNGYLYIIFLLLQIVCYSAGTYAVERGLWGVNRNFDRIGADSDVALRCTGLTKTYYGKRQWYWPFSKKGATVVAINDLNLEVKKGSVTFLLGPNGGGKSTSLKAIAGMINMDSGSRLELNEAGLVFGICPQQNVFWDTLTVNEHIKIWRKLKTAAFVTDQADDDDVIAECDLIEKTQAQAKTLSGGQMRKLQLAIAFVGSSKVCCIDEASSGLDPLSRRNIWNIVQKGRSRRTILMTTHFLDEADVLSDHIAIVYKGKLVCEGPGTSLKARFGDNYIIRSDSGTEDDNLVWRTTNSAEATRKILELEALSAEDTYNVVFPTLEQVFLKVTSESNTAIHDVGGDGMVGEQETDTVIDEKIEALEEQRAQNIDLDVGHSIGVARQVFTLFKKRHVLLRQKAGWISYGINLIIPIIIASALVKFHYGFKSLQTCQTNELLLRNGTQSEKTYGESPSLFAPLAAYNGPELYLYDSTPTAYLGPQSEFVGTAQDALYLASLANLKIYSSGNTCSNESCLATELVATRQLVNNTADMIFGITNSSGYGYDGFGIYAPSPESAILFYSTENYDSAIEVGMDAFGFITNRISNSSTDTGKARISSATLRTMVHAENNVSLLSLPISALIALAFIAATSISVIYPTFERINQVRALHYCNGVSPFALWTGYLLFDMQFILVESIFVWGLLYAGPLARLYYESNYILGVFILFGIATYLGNYLLSLFVKKAAFAIAAGLHVLLFVLYLVAYVMNQSFGNGSMLYSTYSNIQYGLGLSSPAANLLRGLFVATNSFEILCGKYGDADVSNPFAYVRYGSVYANLLIQIAFLIAVLYIYEYGSADWIRRNIIHRGVPPRLHYVVDAVGSTRAEPPRSPHQHEKNLGAFQRPPTGPILDVSSITKYFGKVFAVENVSFDIAANQTLALLGGNGAGKTTVINMIRGELVPNFGDISLDGVSVLKNPHKARLHMGVCPQDDAVDNLTVRQTLNFYATVKGLKNVSGNVDRVLAALNITIYEHVSVKGLSGGTRRKLSVAIALLGNPRVLLLDEPSTGQDAGAKRILWKALQSISANRAILLTTHSMEEAEALATNVAIMGTKMLATGTLSSLQTVYGGSFSVRAVRAGGIDRDQAMSLIKADFDDIIGYIDSHGQISFRLPHNKRMLGKMMEKMEKLKGDVGDERAGSSGMKVIDEYTITGPTLEEVFMNVAREAGHSGIV
ncbi:P-loop containing nucleoside triphosphate hydrolase protein [Mollisia scopiformis]|uniref:p-loop containing nucleoside triphosphate hydrolase protein n=1 Tax=Mollisia scopiformis TaxID=149040 RepID=A0A194XH26_MOLSC|nr:P-loop containing nucleoside triphosphate hydrolase protein [Mollisia scopiformis]KUJ19510.1 P-loop containing nucleoside triphosphate hydrolase protein [Mollisia scopiformis]